MFQMKRRYFQLYNLVDWVVYLLAMVFVFDICIHHNFGWVGCEGPKVTYYTTQSCNFRVVAIRVRGR